MNSESHANMGNNYGRNNKGKQYNKICTSTNGHCQDNKTHIVKVIVHINGNRNITSLAVYYSDGSVNDTDTLSKTIKRVISKWHKTTVKYYRVTEYIMADIIYSCYFEEDTFIKKQMRCYNEQKSSI